MRTVAEDISDPILPVLEWSKDSEILRKQIEAVLASKHSRKPSKKKKSAKKHTKPKPEPQEVQRFWEQEPWQENFISTLPPYIHCAGEDFAKGTFKRSRDLALNYPHIQVNSPCRKVWLPFDLDSSDAVRAHKAAGLPAPNIVVENMANGGKRQASHGRLGIARRRQTAKLKVRQSPSQDRGGFRGGG